VGGFASVALASVELREEEKEEACVEREFDAFFGCFRHLEVEFVTSFLNSIWSQ
jgi:hypothetical protein